MSTTAQVLGKSVQSKTEGKFTNDLELTYGMKLVTSTINVRTQTHHINNNVSPNAKGKELRVQYKRGKFLLK